MPTKIDSMGSSIIACILARTFSGTKNEYRKGLKRELAAFDETRRAVGMTTRTEEEKRCVTTACAEEER